MLKHSGVANCVVISSLINKPKSPPYALVSRCDKAIRAACLWQLLAKFEAEPSQVADYYSDFGGEAGS